MPQRQDLAMTLNREKQINQVISYYLSAFRQKNNCFSFSFFLNFVTLSFKLVVRTSQENNSRTNRRDYSFKEKIRNNLYLRASGIK